MFGAGERICGQASLSGQGLRSDSRPPNVICPNTPITPASPTAFTSPHFHRISARKRIHCFQHSTTYSCNVSLNRCLRACDTVSALQRHANTCPAMPTPSEDTVHPAASIAAATSSRTIFTSCPPDEIRDHHAPREERLAAGGRPQPSRGHEESARDPAAALDTRRRSEGDVEPAILTGVRMCDVSPQREHIEDTGLTIEPSSPRSGSPDAPSESDVRLAQSMSTAAISTEASQPQYLHFPDLHQDRVGLPMVQFAVRGTDHRCSKYRILLLHPF